MKKIYIILVSVFLIELIFVSKINFAKLENKRPVSYYKIQSVMKPYIKINNKLLIDSILEASHKILNNKYMNFTCILQTESGFSNSKIGDFGTAFGIGQLHKNAILESCKFLKLKLCNLTLLIKQVKYNSNMSIKLSAGYIAYLLKRFNNNWSKTIVAYNIGETSVLNGKSNTVYLNKVQKCVIKMNRGK